jgi:hypothetical protein
MAGVGAQVFELHCILGRNDKAELVPVFAATFLESGQFGLVGDRPIALARFTVTSHTLALDVAQVGGGRACTGLAQIHQPGFDGDTSRIGRQCLAHEPRRHVPTPQPGSRLFPSLVDRTSASLAALSQHLGHKGLRTILGCTRANPETVAGIGMIGTAACAHGVTPSKPIAR